MNVRRVSRMVYVSIVVVVVDECELAIAMEEGVVLVSVVVRRKRKKLMKGLMRTATVPRQSQQVVVE